MSLARRIDRIVTVPPLRPGFAGNGHLAAAVVPPGDFAATDPFIALMDDHLDMGDRQVGGAHPHAGFETVTLVLDGTISDPDEGGLLHAGDVQWMTAGSGIIHGENTHAHGKARLLQLWLTLPPSQRWIPPSFQDVSDDRVPVRREPGAEVRVYSGASNGVTSPTRNQVPVTIAEFTLQAGATIVQDLPASYNGFVFIVNGSIDVGPDATRLESGQVGWLDRQSITGTSDLQITASANGARLVLYAGQPQGTPIVAHGPFIGDTRDDIQRLYAEYRVGQFTRMSTVAAPVRAQR